MLRLIVTRSESSDDDAASHGELAEARPPRRRQPQWLRDYQDAKRRFDEALEDLHSALLVAPEPFELLSVSEKFLIDQVRRRFRLRLIEPPVRSLVAVRRAHTDLDPDGGAA